MTRDRFSRRALLSSLGLGAGLVPVLAPGLSRAADATARAKRLIVVAVPNGYTADFLPVASGTGWAPKQVEFAPLGPLVPYKDRVLILGGINLQNGIDTARAIKGTSIGGHASLPFLLTGAKGVPGPAIPDGWNLSSGYASVDQYVVQNLPGAKARPFPSLVLRPLKTSGYGGQPLSYSGKCLDGATHNAPTMRDDPAKLFDDLFGGNLDTGTLNKLRAQRQSILDFTASQLRALQTRVGQDDRVRIQNHLDGIQRIEGQLAALAGAASCKKGTRPDDAAIWVTSQFNPHMDLVIKAQIEMTVAAMACDLTRVASHLWVSSTNNTIVFNWLAGDVPTLGQPYSGSNNAGSGNTFMNHHTVAHNDAMYRREKNRIDMYFMEAYAYFIKLLSETLDFDGQPMIKNTLVLLANMQRTGGGHQTDNMIWFLAGNADGYFKQGRWLPWVSGTDGKTAPTNGLLTALANAMGCPHSDYYADPAYGGELATLRN
jgi:hypothetical protein